MERLQQRALLEFLREIYALRDLDAFSTHVISALPKVVPSEITSYNEVNPWRRRISWVFAPADTLDPKLKPIFEQHILEHPIISYYQRTHDGQALKISDFLTRSQFHRLGLYNEFYRRVNVGYQMAFTLPAPQPLIIGIALNRGRSNFTERDRLILNLLRPHLIQAYRNAEAVTEMKRELALVRQAIETLDRGVVVLTREGRVRLMTARARQWLAEYFGHSSRRADRLPETLERWVRNQDAGMASPDTLAPPREPLGVEREGKRLVVRHLCDATQCLLIIEQRQTTLQPTALESLGLTRREAEVLAWVAQGKSNAEVGTILDVSPRTAQKHLERIYQKLGVETRTAAAAQALQATGRTAR